MARCEFPRTVKVEVVKRATRGNSVYCEACGLPAKKFQIDHVIADAHGGKPVIENAMLICEPCFSIKNPKDTTIAAKLKRQEEKHLGAIRPKAKIAAPPKRERQSKPGVVRQWAIYRDIEP